MEKKKLGFAAAALTTFASTSAFAQGTGGGADTSYQAYAALGAGLAIGLAVLGAGMGQGRAASAALDGISRNPGAADRIQTPFILGMALIESLALFAFAIAVMLWLKLP
jgi:F-type H+-transporting ATPase subunit c